MRCPLMPVCLHVARGELGALSVMLIFASHPPSGMASPFQFDGFAYIVLFFFKSSPKDMGFYFILFFKLILERESG